ncbi:phosphoribosylformylglycinamidine cyclo-ligase [Paenibacillus aurantiacus]|uniref:Phosphoribosylformylglycinamidine cyclo-ligase n=1 Tax=Paenibacillus aurantiacus TaxID=1936118 RepID=A0ABV5L100_9BACL
MDNHGVRRHTYKEAGVDVKGAERAKGRMGTLTATADPRVLNRSGAFASLFLPRFEGIDDPVLVLKSEEPGSKQQLAFEHGQIKSICQDLIHHLVNDIVVMGARPEVVLDTILCGRIESETVLAIVEHLAEACRALGCSLVGGETSEQPGVLAAGQYMLNASILGVADRTRIVDGSRIRPGDKVVALASNGLHTNGYSLVRRLMADRPEITQETIGEMSFLDAILLPHTCYYKPLRGWLGNAAIQGMAHITGGGIEGNVKRILPAGTTARIELGRLEVLPIFSVIQRYGHVPADDMLQTFNMGVGLVVVVEAAKVAEFTGDLKMSGCQAYEIGDIFAGQGDVQFAGELPA